MRVKRLLCIVGGMNAGGAETFLMKVYRELDKTKYQMDFAVAIEEQGYYDEEILSMGGRIHHITPKSKGFIQNFNSIKRIVKDNGYEAVLRTSQNSLSALELYAAKLGGAKTRIFRSSNSNTMSGGKDKIVHKLCGFMPKMFANVRIAPSTLAADFMFGKGSVASGKAKILHNAVDLDYFKYDEESRKACRVEFGIEDRFVVGHVGRFNSQKNHRFLLKVFQQIREERPDAVLVLVGQGELEDSIRQTVEQMQLQECVIFAGVRKDIPALMSAMDVFVFPSFYEGMPNTVIEAQATGLPCVIANTITPEAKITDIVEYVSLSLPEQQWAKKALRLASVPRKDTRGDLEQDKYDIQSVALEFLKLLNWD